MRAVDLMAISAASQPPNDTPTTAIVRERQLIDEVEIEIGEVVDAVEPARRLRAAEAGMGRRQHTRARGQRVEHRRVRLDADAGMQEQQRPALPALDHLDADAVDGDRAGTLRQRMSSDGSWSGCDRERRTIVTQAARGRQMGTAGAMPCSQFAGDFGSLAGGAGRATLPRDGQLTCTDQRNVPGLAPAGAGAFARRL